MTELRSDNSAGVAPAIIDAVVAENSGSALAYGGDATTAELERVVRTVFEHPTARVFPVTSGTAMNALALSAMTPPWGAVYCHRTAHISESEANATSLLSGGAALRGVDGEHGLIEPDALRAALGAVRLGDNHHSQPAVLSLTQPTDLGTVYPLDRVRELVGVANEYEMRTHIDGARLANALVALGCSAADLTWRSGVSAVSVGATKNGALSAEAIVVFDETIADELVYRTKRAGHVTSKMRFQSAQLIAYFTDDYWLDLARNANECMRDLLEAVDSVAGLEPVSPVDANMVFFRADEHIAERLEQAGVLFYRIGDHIRFVTSWATTASDIEAVAQAIRG